MPDLEYAVAREDEQEPLVDVLSQSFHFPRDDALAFIRMAGPQVRVVRLGGEIVGGLVIHDMGQWFGGREIPMGAIGAVGVAPHVRARGVAAFLMTETVRELRSRNVPLSTLWASTQVLYRKVGYEQAGSWVRYEVPTRCLPRYISDLDVHPVDPKEHGVLRDLAARLPRENGSARRDELLWNELARPGTDRLFAYLVGPVEKPRGYVLFFQSKGDDGFVLTVKDLVALDRAARERIFNLISDHRSLGRTLRFDGGLSCPHLILFKEQEFRVWKSERFLLRITDVRAALESRGYPREVEGEIHLEIEDETVPENAGRWVLRLADGKGTVEPGGRGILGIHARSLAPLYTGLHSAGTLAELGLVTADEESIHLAGKAFAGPEPVMSERF
jgi:predicted acetyltransferase